MNKIREIFENELKLKFFNDDTVTKIDRIMKKKDEEIKELKKNETYFQNEMNNHIKLGTYYYNEIVRLKKELMMLKK